MVVDKSDVPAVFLDRLKKRSQKSFIVRIENQAKIIVFIQPRILLKRAKNQFRLQEMIFFRRGVHIDHIHSFADFFQCEIKCKLRPQTVAIALLVSRQKDVLGLLDLGEQFFHQISLELWLVCSSRAKVDNALHCEMPAKNKACLFVSPKSSKVFRFARESYG